MTKQRKSMIVTGLVQGVGFRPFVYRIAAQQNLAGFVFNSERGVEIEVEGTPGDLDIFSQRLQKEKPPLAFIQSVKERSVALKGGHEFVIHNSMGKNKADTLVSPDIGVCDDCLRELRDLQDRRYHYPFINCTNCGPRYTIIEEIPYDRPKTTMSEFKMCADCRQEYEDPENRRFHAQPNACPVCGPHVWLCDGKGKNIKTSDPFVKAAEMLRSGQIAAVKGLGGFHLACDAANADAVKNLRARKHRYAKPLAVMAENPGDIHVFAVINTKEKDMLLNPRRPIVLLRKRTPFPLASELSPGNPFIGVMLPYTPLHALLLEESNCPLVMTSGNLSEEPIAMENTEALKRLGNIADFYIMHNRKIYMRCDDSVFKSERNMPRPLRRSRGWTPMPVALEKECPPVLAAGPELKNTICITRKNNAFMSQHIGDLENWETLSYFEQSVEHLSKILGVKPSVIAYDLHPDYLSTQWALKQKKCRLIGVQHHHAHIVSCMAENGHYESVIGLAFDGTGYGIDGSIWGGEVLIADTHHFQRAAALQETRIPGGEIAVREPWRMTVSYLADFLAVNKNDKHKDSIIDILIKTGIYQSAGEERINIVLSQLKNHINVIPCTSMGRLFDGLAALCGMRLYADFEAQAAIELEGVLPYPVVVLNEAESYQFHLIDNEPVRLSLHALWKDVLDDLSDGISKAVISARFHWGLVHAFTRLCVIFREKYKISTVALSGGCFQNSFLQEQLSLELEKAGFNVLLHSQVPANDGGIALGQAVIAASKILKSNYFTD